MSGTPLYPKDLATEWERMKRDVKDIFTSANYRRAQQNINTGYLTVANGGLLVRDDVGDIQAIVGLLPNGNYGIAATNGGTTLVELNTLALGIQSDTVTSFQSTTNNNYTDLSTVGPSVTVTVGTAATVLVTIGCNLEFDIPKIPTNSVASYGGYMSFAVSGAATINPLDQNAFGKRHRVDTSGSGSWNAVTTQEIAGSRQAKVDLPGPGTYTFTAKYLAYSAGTATFGNRTITVQPF